MNQLKRITYNNFVNTGQMLPLGKRRSEQKPQSNTHNERAQLMQQIMRNRQGLGKIQRKIQEQTMKYQKIMESNMRNQKRLQRYRARIEEMGKHKDHPQHFLTLSGFMNQCIQEYIIGHNYAFNENNHNNQGDPNPDNMTYEQLLELGDQIGKVSKGLTKEEIQKLQHKRNKKEGEQCPICQHQLQKGMVVIQLKCKHTYHDDCILLWLKDQNTCPICKQYLSEEKQMEEC